MANTDTATVAKRNGNGNGHKATPVTRNVPTMAQARAKAKILGTAHGKGRTSEIEWFTDIAWFGFHGTLPHADTAADATDGIDHVRNLITDFYTASAEARGALDPDRKDESTDDTVDNKVSKYRHAAKLGAIEDIDLETFFDNVASAVATVRVSGGRKRKQTFECYVSCAKAQHETESAKLVSMATLKDACRPGAPPVRSVAKQWELILSRVEAMVAADGPDRSKDAKDIRDKVAGRVSEWNEKLAKNKKK